ncbi:MAG: hypothetical protein KAV87_59140 [Desulfobacteraceae bacterium]|nr:hypothetical protein [Desulfobacteraceae bacterium]
MRMKSNFFILVVFCISALTILAFISCATTETSKKATGAAISIIGNGVPGKILKINGTGFIPGEVIELVLEMEDIPIIVGRKGKVVKVKEDGTFTAKTNYPNKLVAIPGSWDLVAKGNKGSTAICKVEIKKP